MANGEPRPVPIVDARASRVAQGLTAVLTLIPIATGQWPLLALPLARFLTKRLLVRLHLWEKRVLIIGSKNGTREVIGAVLQANHSQEVPRSGDEGPPSLGERQGELYVFEGRQGGNQVEELEYKADVVAA